MHRHGFDRAAVPRGVLAAEAVAPQRLLAEMPPALIGSRVIKPRQKCKKARTTISETFRESMALALRLGRIFGHRCQAAMFAEQRERGQPRRRQHTLLRRSAADRTHEPISCYTQYITPSGVLSSIFKHFYSLLAKDIHCPKSEKKRPCLVLVGRFGFRRGGL